MWRTLKKTVIAVIGPRNAGKSSIIKSLTGCETNGFKGFITNKKTRKKIYVIASSPQENDLSEKELKSIFDEIKEDRDCLGLVIAIQPNRPTKRMRMENIFQLFSEGFNVFAFIVDPTYQGLPGNENNFIKERLAGLNIKLTTLDGRKFAFENATIIQAETKLYGK